MLRPLRLRASADFARARKIGRTIRHPLVALNSAPNTLDHNRYGFIVAKKVGGAVVRNRVKRRMREAVRARHSGLLQGFDLIWIARNEAATATYIQLCDAAEELLRRAKLLKGEEKR